MNKVLLVGRLTRDPELRSLPSGRGVVTFTVKTDDLIPDSEGKLHPYSEYHPCVAWDKLALVLGEFLLKNQMVSLEGRNQTRQWDDDAGKRHWKTECVVAGLRIVSPLGKAADLDHRLAAGDAP